MRTIVYTDGGKTYLGEHSESNLSYWKRFISGHKYMYKGYRYFDGKRDIVIVYDNIEWSKVEKAKRYNNGFLGIREYIL